ncbi:MAG: carboxypeptidase regulatory-like domain-containing protein [Acidobacteriota bacterium]
MREPALRALLALFCVMLVGPAQAETELLGDVDLDGRLDLHDLALLQDHVAERRVLSPEAAGLADVDLDGAVDASDEAALVDALLGRRLPRYVSRGDGPTLLATLSAVPNEHGWFSEPVTIEYTCLPNGSEVVECPGPVTLDTEGARLRVKRTAIDAAVRARSLELFFDIDLSPPVLRVVPDGAPSSEGWHRQPVTIAFEATDELSGLVSVAPPVLVSAEGRSTLNGWAIDRAGHRVDVSSQVLVDTTPPTLQVVVSPEAGPTGLHREDVLVRFLADDAGSGIAHVTRDQVVARNGLDLEVPGIAIDRAGNSASVTVVLDVERPPSGPVPSLAIDYPLPGVTTERAVTDVAGTVHDLVAGTVNPPQCRVTVNGVPAEVLNRSFLLRGVPLVLGENLIEVVATDVDGNEVREDVTIERVPPGLFRLEVVEGDGQVGTPGEVLPELLSVRAVDDAGVPLPFLPVELEVSRGGGVLGDGDRHATAVTDVDGRAAIAFQLGPRAGVGLHRVRAMLTGLGGEVELVATARADAARGLAWVAGDGQRGGIDEVLPEPLVALALDEHGNPVAGEEVLFEVLDGDGLIDGRRAVTRVTDGDGRVAVDLRLGLETGYDNNLVLASLVDDPEATLGFRASTFSLGNPELTRIVGLVIDNQDAPVPGATLTLDGQESSTVTDEDGRFVLAGVIPGHLHLRCDATTTTREGVWPRLEFVIDALPGIDNTLLDGPIQVLPIEVEEGVEVSATEGAVLTLSSLPGVELSIEAGSATFPDGGSSGLVSLTQVNVDRIPMAPGAGLQPSLAFTLQPGGTHFDPPVRVTVPNLRGLVPGRVVELFSFDHDLVQFVSVGPGTVSEDGATITSDPNHGIHEAGWWLVSPPPEFGDLSTLGLSVEDQELCLNEEREVTVQGYPRTGRRLRFEWEVPEAYEDILEIDPPGGASCESSRLADCSVTIRGLSAGRGLLRVRVVDLESGEEDGSGQRSASELIDVTVTDDNYLLEVVLPFRDGATVAAGRQMALSASLYETDGDCEWVPVERGAVLRWSVSGGGVLADPTTPVTDGLALNTLTAPDGAGAELELVVELSTIDDEELEPPLPPVHRSLPVIPGPADRLIVSREAHFVGHESRDTDRVTADDLSSVRFDLEARDEHGNCVEERELRASHSGVGHLVVQFDGLAGGPPVESDPPGCSRYAVTVSAGSYAEGHADGSIVDDDIDFFLDELIESRKLHPRAIEVQLETFRAEAPTVRASRIDEHLPLDEERLLVVATVFAGDLPVSDGTEIFFHASSGELRSLTGDRRSTQHMVWDTVQDGKAMVFLDAGANVRLGDALVTAMVGTTRNFVEVEFTSSAPTTIETTSSLLVGDGQSGSYWVERADESFEQVFYETETDVRIETTEHDDDRRRIALDVAGPFAPHFLLHPPEGWTLRIGSNYVAESYAYESGQLVLHVPPGPVSVDARLESLFTLPSTTVGGVLALSATVESIDDIILTEGEPEPPFVATREVAVTSEGYFGPVVHFTENTVVGFATGGGEGAGSFVGDLAASVFIWGDVRDLAIYIAAQWGADVETDHLTGALAFIGLLLELGPVVLEAPDATVGAMKAVAKKANRGPVREWLVAICKRFGRCLRDSVLGSPPLSPDGSVVLATASCNVDFHHLMIRIAARSSDDITAIGRVVRDRQTMSRLASLQRRLDGRWDILDDILWVSGTGFRGGAKQSRAAVNSLLDFYARVDDDLLELIKDVPNARRAIMMASPSTNSTTVATLLRPGNIFAEATDPGRVKFLEQLEELTRVNQELVSGKLRQLPGLQQRFKDIAGNLRSGGEFRGYLLEFRRAAERAAAGKKTPRIDPDEKIPPLPGHTKDIDGDLWGEEAIEQVKLKGQLAIDEIAGSVDPERFLQKLLDNDAACMAHAGLSYRVCVALGEKDKLFDLIRGVPGLDDVDDLIGMIEPFIKEADLGIPLD